MCTARRRVRAFRQYFPQPRRGARCGIEVGGIRSGCGDRERNDGGNIAQFATKEEAEAFGKVFPSVPEALTLLWAAKEACRKALGARQVAAHDIHLGEIRKVDEYGAAVFLHPGGEMRCAAFAENDYAWAAAH